MRPLSISLLLLLFSAPAWAACEGEVAPTTAATRGCAERAAQSHEERLQAEVARLSEALQDESRRTLFAAEQEAWTAWREATCALEADQAREPGTMMRGSMAAELHAGCMGYQARRRLKALVGITEMFSLK